MPIDKNKLRRFQVLDRCFSDQVNKYYIEDLIRECNIALAFAGYENKSVSRSTIFNDIREMSSNSQWNALLLEGQDSYDGKRRFYRYEDPNFSIWKRDLDESQLAQLQSVLLLLQQFKDFPQSDAIEDVIEQVSRNYQFDMPNTAGIMSFEPNENIESLNKIGDLFSHIMHKHVLDIIYQPFGKEPIRFIVHPHFLKQFNRRWFLIGLTLSDEGRKSRHVIPLDRIKSIKQIPGQYIPSDKDLEDLFYDQIGVTLLKVDPVVVKLRFSPSRFYYVLSKPIHQSQKLVKGEDNTITIKVKPNNELYQTLLAFGADLRVLEPKSVREKMQEEIQKMQEIYSSPIL